MHEQSEVSLEEEYLQVCKSNDHEFYNTFLQQNRMSVITELELKKGLYSVYDLCMCTLQNDNVLEFVEKEKKVSPRRKLLHVYLYTTCVGCLTEYILI